MTFLKFSQNLIFWFANVGVIFAACNLDLIVNNKDENSNDVANPQDLSNVSVSNQLF